MTDSNINIRVATVQDAAMLLEIYAVYVEKTAITFEYDIPTIEEFEKRIQQVLEKYPYIVAECNGKILGYAYASTFKNRAAYDWTVEVSIYIDMNQRGSGIGSRLYEALEKLLKEQGVLNLTACIAYPEIEDEYLTRGSVSFHEKLGYQFVGRFHKCGYKFNRWYDMVWMEKHIGVHGEQQQPIKLFNKLSY